MNTENNEMKTKEEHDFIDVINDFYAREKFYNEQSKEALVNMLLMKDMLDDAFDAENHEMQLWYYVGDDTGAKYLSNKMPKVYFILDDPLITVNTDDVPIAKPKQVWITDGEVNIRVPKCMESMFPTLKYGDNPVKINMSIVF